MMTTRILIVDDSALMRKLLTEFINSVPDLEVIGVAPDAHSARQMIKLLKPDVLTLDVQMPGMDGLAFLEKIMRLRPMPVVMVSSFTEAGSETTLKALELGAVDFIGKPRLDNSQTIAEYTLELTEKIRAAKGARLYPISSSSSSISQEKTPVSHTYQHLPAISTDKVVVVGASTGGTEAIKQFLVGMPTDCPPILIVQHMPEAFTGSFSRRLNNYCSPKVIEAANNMPLERGTVYIAPGHSHLLLRPSGSGYVTVLQQSPPVNRHRPSVDVLFNSAAEVLGRNAVGVILTGMGKDGAQGLLRLRQAGAHTIGQDEASCVVYGMPREAFLVGAIAEVASLEHIARQTLLAVHHTTV